MRENGRWVLHWSSIDLVDGTRTGTVAAGGSKLQTINYVPFGTVEPGLNQLRFRAECSGAPVANLEVLGSTRLRETQTQPAHLRLSAPEASREPESGAAVPVRFKIVNTGDLAALDVEVQLVSEGEAKPIGRTRYLYSRLSGKRTGEFLIVPRGPGPFTVELTASSGNSNQPAVGLKGVAGKPSSQHGAVASPWLGVAALTAGAALALMLVRRRRSRARGTR
jgi:hypothetical protein